MAKITIISSFVALLLARDVIRAPLCADLYFVRLSLLSRGKPRLPRTSCRFAEYCPSTEVPVYIRPSDSISSWPGGDIGRLWILYVC